MIPKSNVATLLTATCLCLASQAAGAQEVLKLGMSLPLSGSGAVWGQVTEHLCKVAAKEIAAAGGIKVKGKSYNLECVAYDNKYTSADGTKVAQTLLNRDGARYICAVGSAPILAAQSMTERQGALLFSTAWAKSAKGPQFPLTFSVINSPNELMPPMVEFLKQAHPQAKRLALLNANDSTGRDTEAVARPMWEKAGYTLVANDFYERGTTEFQPIANRLMAQKPDIIDLATVPPADAGQIFKELAVLGYKGVKSSLNGTAAEGFIKTGGPAANGVYIAAAITFEGAGITEYQKKYNAEVKSQFGDSIGIATVGCYDAAYMLKAAAEKAQSLEPKDMAAAMPTVRFHSFWGDNMAFGGAEIYGSVQQAQLPAQITQIVDGNLVLKGNISPKPAK